MKVNFVVLLLIMSLATFLVFPRMDKIRMHELERALNGDSAAAPPAHILEGLSDQQAHQRISGAPHTVYEEAWHIGFWLRMTLDWVNGIETPYPANPVIPFPTREQTLNEPWTQLRGRLLAGIEDAANMVRDASRMEGTVRCPSRPGDPLRSMTVREQLESLAAHNAYHFGRIVLLRQLLGTWPPRSGGFTW